MTRSAAFVAMALPVLARRSLLALPGLLPAATSGPTIGASALVLAGGSPAQASNAGSAVLLAPGPEDGPAADWARRAARGLARGLPRAAAPRVATLGGPDGVTAANRFAALPDDAQALVLNGPATLARLSGSSRVRFDPAGWLPLLASWRGALVVGRGPRPEEGPARAAPIRLPLPAPCSPEAAVLLALEAMGARVQAVTGRNQVEAPEDAFSAGELDALLLLGVDAPARAQAIGALPWFTVNAAENGAVSPPSLPDLAHLLPAVPLREAARAAIATAQWQAGLVLPLLTAADGVALWRHAASRWQEAERADPEAGGTPLIGPEALAALSLAAPSADTLFAWREWLLRRMGWQAD